MSDRVPDRIAVTYTLTARDYALHAAAVDRHSRNWASLFILLAVFFSAIPVALLFRALAAARAHDAVMIETVGRDSLFAFALGCLAMLIGGAIGTQLMRHRLYRRVAGLRGARTVVLDDNGISLAGTGSEQKWHWSAVAGLSVTRELLLIWVAPLTAVAIPVRCLGDDGSQAATAFIRARLGQALPENSG